jgi:hypothetical protein
MIVQRRETIVQRVETTVPRHQAYRLLRAFDRDAWLRQAIDRFADPIACVCEAIARLADPVVRGSRSRRVTRTSRTVSSESSDAMRGSGASDRGSLRLNGSNNRMNGRSCANLRRSPATMTQSVGPRAKSYREDRLSDRLVDSIARVSKAKRQDGFTITLRLERSAPCDTWIVPRAALIVPLAALTRFLVEPTVLWPKRNSSNVGCHPTAR